MDHLRRLKLCEFTRAVLPTAANQAKESSTTAPSPQHGMMNDDGECSAVATHGPPTTTKPLRLRNLVQKTESFDSLHHKPSEEVPCNQHVCLGSLMAPQSRLDARTPAEVQRHAKDFLQQYFTSIRRANSAAHAARWEQVQRDIAETGTYQLTETELIYGAKLAWRNAARCIGRIQWSKLQVFDCRYVTTTSGMFEALCNHIKYSTNKGNIRSAITIFPQRTDGRHDFRVWNPQLISYAGYRQSDGSTLGDPLNAEFTEVCLKLGWRGKNTAWDILPLVLSANGHDPDYFDIPAEYIFEVPLSHPEYSWFEKLHLKWYALPAVSSMMFDVGGLQFTAAPFNGWYMGTEIGCRNMCDVQRLNMLETVAEAMGLDTRSSTTLWRDKALVEVNVAVLYSFQQKGVTIVDHHTASESFMKHLENEVRLRNGCPADWVWIVPPMSGSATPVFHQEMAMYFLKPSYEYQEVAWRCHVWKKGRDTIKSRKPRRKFHFKQIARAVKFTSKLFGRALSRRIKATILYGTETGKSESYAKILVEIFGHAFNAQVYCLQDYDISSIEHEALLLVITSTFGNGDPPENGEDFAKNLYGLKLHEHVGAGGEESGRLSMLASKSFIKANSQSDSTVKNRKLDRLNSLKESTTETLPEDTFGPLSNVRFAVFALGSSAYPNFCAFGKYVDNLLGELGGERLMSIASGDEMCGQEQAFHKWAPEIFKISCATFCLDDDDSAIAQATAQALQADSLTPQTVRFTETTEQPTVTKALSQCHHKVVLPARLINRAHLHGGSKSTLFLELKVDNNVELSYKPGDHLGIFARNHPDLVNGIIKRLRGTPDSLDEPMQLQVLKEQTTSNGVVRTWQSHDRLPTCSVRDLFTYFLDLTTPPTPNLLSQLAVAAESEDDNQTLNLLARDPAAYEDWRHFRFPNLLEVLNEFPSVTPYAPLLAAQLSLLQPRFYSISSSPTLYPQHVHLTVAVVVYRTEDGSGPLHYGVCSNYLKEVTLSEEIVNVFVRSAPNFHLPADQTRPVILVGPGTGIAPFRSFWQHRSVHQNNAIGKMWLFYGCRTRDMDLYYAEKQKMLEQGVLDRVFLALSREDDVPKTYVQDLALSESNAIYQLLVKERGHFYVCGDCTMAEHVYQTLKSIIQKQGAMSDGQVEAYMLSLRDDNRYHEDIFGITLRTAEIHNRSRESARIRMANMDTA